MEGSPYHPNGMNNNGYNPNPAGVSPHQLQHNNLPAHTLPPLQQQQHAMTGMYSNNGTPRTPATPGTPGSGSNLGSFPQQQQQQQQQMGNQSRPYQQMINNYPPQNNQVYRGSMLPQTSGALSHPQPIAPAPIQGRNMPQPLRPMPPNGIHNGMQPGMQSPYGQNSNFMQAGMLDPSEPPTHVVGSQGRRGILPSAPGRPAVTATGPGSGKSTIIPQKDADGKFPCPHCTKTYLHAKHLKRHLLRHTGDRPYMCVLCRDTFSRSDILKRHFQKCSIRRGNPTGASHLSAQAHLKKSHPGPHKNATSMGNENDMMGHNGVNNNNSMTDPALSHHQFGIIPGGNVADASSHMTNQQVQEQMQQQSNELKRLSGGQGGQGYNPGMGNTMPPGMNPSLAFSIPNGQNGRSYSQNYEYAGSAPNLQPQPSTTYQTNSNTRNFMNTITTNGYAPAPTNYYNTSNPSTSVPIKPENGQYPIKSEPDAGVGSALMNGFNLAADFPNWNFQNDPLQDVSNRLLLLCTSTNHTTNNQSSQLRQYLSPDNIKHALEQFSSFQGHFPTVHMPSFRITEASDSMLLGMVCVGAVYSDRMTDVQVRGLMDIAKTAIESSSQLYMQLSRGYPATTAITGNSEVEQLSAIILVQVLFTWHGTPVQREEARRQFHTIAQMARKIGLMDVLNTGRFSALHQPGATADTIAAAAFNWDAWVQQEKRSRLMFMIFLHDAARAMYFNLEPLFDPLEIRVPLPADDAAWDASTSAECARALGLNGLILAQDINPEGSRRAKQPEMHSAMKALLHDGWNLQPSTTNLYSKFVLVHALHVQLWKSQGQLSQDVGRSLGGTSTPIGQNDWVIRNLDPAAGGRASNNSSGRGTPIESVNQLQATSHAFEKWKKAWDSDMATQYPPPSVSSRRFRRFGFCRDAVHFYWLAKCLMGNNRGLDLRAPPDQRFSHVIALLKYVKQWVVSDSAKRGEELGSVADIESTFAITDLTLNMRELFKPFNKLLDSPVAGVHMNLGGSGGMI